MAISTSLSVQKALPARDLAQHAIESNAPGTWKIADHPALSMISTSSALGKKACRHGALEGHAGGNDSSSHATIKSSVRLFVTGVPHDLPSHDRSLYCDVADFHRIDRKDVVAE